MIQNVISRIMHCLSWIVIDPIFGLDKILGACNIK